MQMYCFCDASESAYVAALYIRTENNELQRVPVDLVLAKTRVAPLKRVIIPRLDWIAAVISAQIISTVARELGVSKSRCYCWTDSLIALHWLNKQPSILKTFVGNRIAEV